MGGYYNAAVAGRMDLEIQSAPASNTIQMSAEPKQATSTEPWTNWQNQIVAGRFALRRCLGWTDHSAVFLTEHKAKNLAEAAIKFVRADAPQRPEPAGARGRRRSTCPIRTWSSFSRWAGMSPDGHDYQFVVMEYADQTLAGDPAPAALNAEEVQELLPPSWTR